MLNYLFGCDITQQYYNHVYCLGVQNAYGRKLADVQYRPLLPSFFSFFFSSFLFFRGYFKQLRVKNLCHVFNSCAFTVEVTVLSFRENIQETRYRLWPQKQEEGEEEQKEKEAKEREDRRRRAKERQQKLMAEFASKQKLFMEKAMETGTRHK
jgi:Na+-translocating ferredoxin:NAD+ oxidoreductase RnfC subunit